MAAAAFRSTIDFRRFGLHIRFSSEGIVVHPIARRPIQVAWSEIDFVSAIPAAEQVDGTWRFKDLGLARGWDILRDRDWFCLDVVVHDRHAIQPRFRWYPTRISPLAMADDRPHPRQGTFPLRIRSRGLDARPTDVLELIARHSRFDLLCHID
jgi:hypothetical protein